ncbi:MAG: electron transport complex subunit RsxG [Pseudomonadota bacterium]
MNLAALRDRLDYQIVLLGATALLAAALLAGANALTRPAIAAAEARDLTESLAQVLPVGAFDNDLATEALSLDTAQGPVTVWRARKEGATTAVVLRLAQPGYSGLIHIVVGIAPDGQVLGVRVLKHTETPGLGDKIETAKGDWIHGFAGKSLTAPEPARWAVKKDGGVFDQFTGATITPRAVVNGVKRALELFANERARLLGEEK